MVRINPEVGKNRLVVEFSGRVSVDELQLAVSHAKVALERLKAPVDLLSDIRQLEGMVALDEPTTKAFRELAGTIGYFGVRKVVRVVGKSAMAAVHLEKLSRSVKNHAAQLAFSLDEAESVLSR